ncbi:hypothetical protein HETIRDRAFT_422610 [Heterobasidion irregulare TC 32-1]|uniref:CCHC-type domain-containing protein n=1 Tax=Heterobasidion irregulare (strain TC 32-1) TaxID=747525 RepID=W4JR29_HETIT|nr:uncharacterized protein HETIRDRAFT_422610 [Heterobasidion irregulare TC 32-1]ETW75998.1 hypothetical protein HETIRDRAFT_422610 [Heterobasidion irregulare TC 32-1]
MPTIRPTSLECSFEPATPSLITLANNIFSPTFDFLTMATPSMPARGDQTAPTFDPHQPCKLRRYFANLDFHFEVYRLYPGSEEERKWSVSDMDKLVGETSRVGILSLSELGNYHRRFLAIMVFLLSKAQILAAEQECAFARGFQLELWARILQCLQLKFPNHFPDGPYNLQDIHDTARFILHGTMSAYNTTSTDISQAAPAVPPTNAIKAKDLATMFERLTNTFVKSIAAQGMSRPANRPSQQPGQGGDNCMFCGSPEHFMCTCPDVTKYIQIGKCKRNIEGKVVLSSGAFVPREIIGSNLKDQVDKWHRRNPGQLATGQMIFMVNAAPTHLMIIASCHDSPSLLDITPTYQLTNVQQIASLKSKDDAPIHPYAKAQDATYAPPHKCNMGAPAKIPLAKKDAPAYKTTAPIYDEKVAAKVYNRVMATQVMLTQRKLLSLSAEVRLQVREATSACRSPAKDASNVRTFYQDANLPYAIDDLEPLTQLTVSSFINILHQPETPPPSAIIIPNMYETYLKNLQPSQVPQPLIVAKELSALRSIVPLVDHQQEVECVIDPGICNKLALIYDPEIVLNMQSANGEIDQSLGLAHNVPFLIGDTTLYLHILIIWNSAYDVLLGQPFNILTKSIVKNYSNEDHMITISDPNKGQRATILTIRQGPPQVLH